jgi:hypothetical protein
MRVRALHDREKAALAAYIPREDLENARLREDGVPWYLPRRFCGITRGNRIYFRPGAYDPASDAGIALLGHELVHVGQYRRGMTALSYLASALRGYLRSRFEREAFALQTRIAQDRLRAGIRSL